MPPLSSEFPHPPAIETHTKISPVWIIFLLLGYTAATQFAVSTGIDDLIAANAENNKFSSQDSLTVFLHLGVIVWSALASYLQALVLRITYRGIVKGTTPSLRRSWFWVLLGQIPFMLTVASIGFILPPDAVSALGEAWIRLLFGATAAVIYVFAAKRAFGAVTGRLVIFFVIVTVVNSVMLVAGGS